MYRGFSGINLVEDEGNSHYEGVQATFRAQSFHNLSVDFAYTYSHTWDVIDGQLFNIAEPLGSLPRSCADGVAAERDTL